MLSIIIKGVTYLINVLTVAAVGKALYNWILVDDDSEKAIYAAADEAGIERIEAKKISAALLYEKIEQDGGDPQKIWDEAPEEVKRKVEYSPKVLSDILDTNKFLGIGATLAWVAGVALIIFASVRGGKIT